MILRKVETAQNIETSSLIGGGEKSIEHQDSTRSTVLTRSPPVTAVDGRRNFTKCAKEELKFTIRVI